MNLINFIKLRKYSKNRGFNLPTFSQSMLDFVKCHCESGFPLDLERVNDGDLDHYKADQVFKGVSYISEIANKPPLSQISILSTIVENPEINAFALKIAPSNRSNYIIGINSGLASEYTEHFINTNAVETMVDGFKSLSQVPIEFLKEAALVMSFCYIAFHEMGHIYRGHLDFFEKRFSFSFLDELSANKTSFDFEGYKFSRHLFECDADAFAGSLMVGEITSRYKSAVESGMFKGSKDRILEELAIFTSSIIYYIFCIFDRSPTTFDGLYPVPPIRTSIAVGHMGAQLYKEGLLERKIHRLAIEGIARTQVAVNQSNMIQSTTELDKEFNRWSQKYKEDLEKLEKLLVPYAPVRIK